MIRRVPKAERTADGIVFDSRAEMDRYFELKLLERAKKIASLEVHPKFPLVIRGNPVLIRSPGYPNGRECVFRADFQYIEYTDDGHSLLVIEESKGVWTDAARLRMAVAECIYGFRIRVTGEAKMQKRRRIAA